MGSDRLTILHVGPISGDHCSGLTYSVPGTVEALHRLGIRAGLLTTSRHGPYMREQSYPVIYYRDCSRRLAFSSLPSFLGRPDLVVFHSTYIPVHVVLALKAARMGVPYVITPRGGMTRGAQRKKRWKKLLGNLLFFGWMVRHAVAIHCLTEREAVDVRAWGRPVFVVGNGIDLPPEAHRARPGRNGRLRFVFVGRLDQNHKGLDLLIEACALAKDALEEVEARVHLYGPDVEGSLAEIEAMVAARDLQDRVQVHGPVYGADKADVFRNADLFLHTSRFEGHPMAVLEALSYGVPCLLTPGTNLSSAVMSAGAGWEVAPQPQAIADGLRSALAGASGLSARGRAARGLAVQEYSWERVGQRLLLEYEKLIGRSRDESNYSQSV